MAVWDIYQWRLRHAAADETVRVRIGQAMGDRDLSNRDNRQDDLADELEDRIAHLVLVTEAVWSLCRDRLGLTDEELRTAVEAAVAEHQASLAAAPVKCASCGAAVPKDMVSCQFCGADTGKTPELFQ